MFAVDARRPSTRLQISTIRIVKVQRWFIILKFRNRYSTLCILKIIKISGSTSCFSCTPGHYADTVNSTSCQSCDSGYVSRDPGAEKCDACNPGRF